MIEPCPPGSGRTASSQLALRSLLLLGAALAIGCTATATPVPATPATSATPPAPAFVCAGEPYRIPERETLAGVPMGRLEVRLLTGPPGRNLEKTHLRVIAENVPLGVFAGALADALGVGVVVTSPLVGVRIGLAVSDISVPNLFLALFHGQKVHSDVYGGLIHLEPDSRASRFNFNLDEGQPVYESGYIETRAVTMPDSLPPAHFAAIFCALYASPLGKAAVAGRRVILHDKSGFLDRADAFLADGWPESVPPQPAPKPAAPPASPGRAKGE